MFIVIGGNPFKMYTGTISYTRTISYTSLRVVAKVNSKVEAFKVHQDNYDECGGLLIIVDGETGGQVDFEEANAAQT